MFRKLAKTLCVVAALGAAGAAAPTAASAGGFGATVTIGGGGVEFVGHRHHRRHYGHCSPGRAVSKARHYGLRHAHVRRVTHRSILVAGRKHHRHALIRFARVRGCPVISYR